MEFAATYLTREFSYWIKRYVYLLPPLQLLSAFVLSFVEIDGYSWVKWGNGSGFSIATGVVYFVLFVIIGRYCLFTKVAACGLFFISLFNFITSFYVTAENYIVYENAYAKIISSLSLVMTFIITLKKSK